jgi:hypothetical protein
MPNKTKRPNKTAFINEHPTLPAAELVKLGAKKGLKFSDKYVYNVRAKAKAGKTGGKPGRPRAAASRTQIRLPNGEVFKPGTGLKLLELTIRADGEEVIHVRMPASVAGPALYNAIASAVAPPPPPR